MIDRKLEERINLDYQRGYDDALQYAMERLAGWKEAVERKRRGEMFPRPELDLEIESADHAWRLVRGLRKGSL